MNNEPYDYLFKIIVAGHSGVGKTSLLNRYVDSIFPENHFTTIGVDFKIKTISVYVNGAPKNVKLQIWDTAGQERFQAVSANYFRGTNGIILVFALNDLKSFNRIQSWMEMADAHKISHRILVGNKADVSDERVVNNDIIAATHRCPYVEASAKTGQAVSEIFSSLATALTESAILDNDKQDRKLDLYEPGSPTEKRTGNKCCGGTG